jgi:hypothetical protein
MTLFQVTMDIIKSEPDLESDNEQDESGEEDPLAVMLPTVKPDAEVRRFSCFTEYRFMRQSCCRE